ncbi:hypothetical protein [Methylotenera versatilis]|uniref:hypothetical protein n=1 Tax=Methylotenera versatilis TaxID=1055487 RepID=UPI00064670D3|nr:hypothetical protein [Methylotenera versatilis]
MHSKYLHRTLAASGLLLLVLNVSADEARIYQQDSTGNTQYHKPSAIIQEDGRIIETDTVGNKQYHKQQYQIKDGKIYQTDSVGNIQYHKPKGVIKK